MQLTQGQTSGFTMIPRTRQTQSQSQPQSQPASQAQAQSNEHHEHLQGGMPSRMGNNPTYTSVAHFRPGEQTGTFFIITARKRSLRRLCFYTCLSFCSQGGCLGPGPGGRLGGLAGVVSRHRPGSGWCPRPTPREGVYPSMH